MEITIPEGLPDSEVAHAVGEALPAIGAYLLGFAVIGSLWVVQHALFRSIAAIDRWLLYLYFPLLALVAALPFPTRLISEYGDTATATAICAGALTLAGALVCGMHLRLVARPELAAAHATPAVLKEAVRRGLLLVLVVASSIPVAFFSPSLAKYWWMPAVPARLLLRDSQGTTEPVAEEGDAQRG